ncbi:hypothetical protein AAFC00_000078 [Neodothiora populina]|uniref:Replication factor A protein 3 n=1 Tax=Neodothiora populina TaxID=2781224 RepID=A0ABR3P1A6_9PEZI
MSEATPRITAEHLQQFSHKTVRILGKVTQLRGETATIDCAGQVTCHLNREAHLTMDHAVEIIGKVQGDLSVRVLVSTDFGTGIDFSAYEAVVQATHRCREIFYDAE